MNDQHNTTHHPHQGDGHNQHASQNQTVQGSYVDDYAPPKSPFARDFSKLVEEPQATQSSSAPASAPASISTEKTAEQKLSQALEDQNIFHLLGIEAAKEEEKEAFLDDLQEVIWEDFLENDVELLLTEEELEEFKKIGNKQGASEEERQLQMVEYLEKLIPDLEQIMLEKALELKEEMFRERIAELKETFKTMPEIVEKIQVVQELIDEGQWRDAADHLNKVIS